MSAVMKSDKRGSIIIEKTNIGSGTVRRGSCNANKKAEEHDFGIASFLLKSSMLHVIPLKSQNA